VKLSGNILLSSYDYNELLTVVGDNSGEPGLAALTLALKTDPQYGRPIVGHYNTSNISGTHDYGLFAIWTKEVKA
jgi:hypothetical protein